jgi:hypothetical protein
MNDQTRSAKLSPQTKRAQGGVGAPHLHAGGPEGNVRGRRAEADPGDRRSGDGSAGTNPSMQRERKDEGWTRRLGGSQEQDR